MCPDVLCRTEGQYATEGSACTTPECMICIFLIDAVSPESVLFSKFASIMVPFLYPSVIRHSYFYAPMIGV